MNTSINLYIDNDKKLMTNYHERPTRIRDSISDKILPDCEKI